MAASSTFLAVFTLIALCAFGVYSMHSLIDRNGYLAAVKDIRDNGPRLLPGSDTPLLEEYTGFHPVDYHMSLMQIFFANVTDGSSPALSMFSFYFAGQIVPVLVVLLAESYRVNQSFLFRFTLPWLLAVQLLGFGVVTPIFAALHLIFAPSNAVLLPFTNIEFNKLISWSVAVGFLLPTLALAYPFRSSHPILYQRAMALWQIFPVFLSLAQFALSVLTRGSSRSDPARKRRYQNLEDTYVFALRVCAFTHITTFVILAISTFYPTLWVHRFFQSFLPDNIIVALSGLSFSSVFAPTNPFPTPFTLDRNLFNGFTWPVKGMAQGFLGFLHWDLYTGMASLFVWGTTLIRRAREPDSPNDFLGDIGAIALLTSMGGPGGLILGMLLHRDACIFTDLADKINAKMQ